MSKPDRGMPATRHPLPSEPRRGADPTSAASEPADEGETEQRSAGDGGKVLRFRDGSQIIPDQIERSEIEG